MQGTGVRRSWPPFRIISTIASAGALGVAIAAAGTGEGDRGGSVDRGLRDEGVRLRSGSTGMVEGGVAGGDLCGGETLTQSLAPGVIEGEFSLACGSSVTTAETSLARSFTLATSFTLGCVTFGIDANKGPAWPVQVRVLTGDVGGPSLSLVPIAEAVVEIPAGIAGTFHVATFEGGIPLSAGETVVVELRTPSRFPADGGDGGAIFLACNNNGQTAPTYIRAPACGLPDFVDAAAIGFPGSQLVLTLAETTPFDFCAGAVPESEACGTDINNGCHSQSTPVFGGFECGMTICGDIHVADGGRDFDVDWYALDLTGAGPLTKVTAMLQANMPARLFIVNDDCDDLAILRAGEGDPLVACVCLPPGRYHVVVGPAVLDGYPCGSPYGLYRLSVDCVDAMPRSCCDQEAIELDADGNPILPPELGGIPPTFVDVHEDRGLVRDLYPQFDTSLDLWYEGNPCDPSVGTFVPREDEADDLDAELVKLGLNGTAAEIIADLESWEESLATLVAGEPDWLITASAVFDGPYAPPSIWCPDPNEQYVFGGRDIVLVHGLKLEHLLDRFAGVRGAQADWVTPTVFPGKVENPEFYSGGYYRSVADDNWSDYVTNFLQASGAKNRYLVVCYQASARVDVGVHSVLTQIADAMRDGEGVVDLSGCGYTKNFGSRSFVVLSHSTGALVTDAAMHAAATKPNLNAGHIVARCKAHIAPSGAFRGSRLATAAVGLSGLIAVSPVAWGDCVLARLALQAFDPAGNLPECGILPGHFGLLIAGLVGNSVLVDLVPVVAQVKWGSAISNSPVRTITAAAGHPTKNAPLKFLLHRGIDDGVVNIDSQTANPNPVIFHPGRFYPALKSKVFDLGLLVTLFDPVRASRYYKDQVFDRAVLPLGVGSGATRWVSPSGMLQPRDQFTLPLLNPHARAPRHYSYLQSAASHPTAIRSQGNYPDYGSSAFGLESNWEETRVLTDPDVYAGYLAGINDNSPLLSGVCAVDLREEIRGRKITFPFPFLNRVFKRELWLWKRTYHLLDGSRAKHQIDYIHETVLCQHLDCTPQSCPSQGPPEDLTGDGIVNAADLSVLLGNWGGGGSGDLNGDGLVGAADLAALLGAWGP